jgi:SsrA-binding protein
MFLVFYHLISTSLFDPSVVRAFLPSPSLLLHHTPPAFPRATTRTPLSRLFAAKKKKKKKGSGDNVIAVNRIAYRNYEIIDTLEAGIALKGTEVKSIRDGKMNLRDGYVKPTKDGRSCILHNVHIGKCNQVGEYYQHEERRPRTLLVHKSQARKYLQQTEQQGMTIVPLRAYFSDSNLVKLQIALVRGKNVRDKRAAIKERDTKRETNRIIKSFRL